MKKNNGLTMMEVVIVLSVIAILSAIIVPSIAGYTERARLRSDIQSAIVVQSAIELYRSETGRNAGGSGITGMIQYLVNADYLSGAPELQTEGAVWHYETTDRRVFIDISNPSASLARLIERLSASDKAFIRPNA